jgi:hypothetical protein
LCLASSSRRIALEVGVPIRTSYRWCWWLRNAALSYEMPRQLEGTTPAILEHGDAVSFHPTSIQVIGTVHHIDHP